MKKMELTTQIMEMQVKLGLDVTSQSKLMRLKKEVLQNMFNDLGSKVVALNMQNLSNKLDEVLEDLNLSVKKEITIADINTELDNQHKLIRQLNEKIEGLKVYDIFENDKDYNQEVGQTIKDLQTQIKAHCLEVDRLKEYRRQYKKAQEMDNLNKKEGIKEVINGYTIL